jgi:hypothetical protein
MKTFLPDDPPEHATDGVLPTTSCSMAEPCAGAGGFLTQTADAIYVTPQHVIDYIKANAP